MKLRKKANGKIDHRRHSSQRSQLTVRHSLLWICSELLFWTLSIPAENLQAMTQEEKLAKFNFSHCQNKVACIQVITQKGKVQDKIKASSKINKISQNKKAKLSTHLMLKLKYLPGRGIIIKLKPGRKSKLHRVNDPDFNLSSSRHSKI